MNLSKAAAGSIREVNRLLEAGADPAGDGEGIPPLHAIARMPLAEPHDGYRQCLEALLAALAERGGDAIRAAVLAPHGEAATVLHAAAGTIWHAETWASGRREVEPTDWPLAPILAAYAGSALPTLSVAIPDASGRTPLDAAKAAKNKLAAETLRAWGAEEPGGNVAGLIEAAGLGCPEAVKLWLAAGADPLGEPGRIPPLHAAAWGRGTPGQGHSQCLDLLIAAIEKTGGGKAVREAVRVQWGPGGGTVLHSAAAGGYVSGTMDGMITAMCGMWFQRGETDPQDENGRTPLHAAIAGEKYKAAWLLHNYFEADPFLPDNDGILPLFLCGAGKWHECRDFVKSIAPLAFVDHVDNDGHGYYWHAATRGAWGLFAFYRRIGLPPEPAAASLRLLWSAARARMRTIRQDIADGADVSAARTERGQTALHLAAANLKPAKDDGNGNAEPMETVEVDDDDPAAIVELLLSNGADPLAIDDNRMTAADFARHRLDIEKKRRQSKGLPEPDPWPHPWSIEPREAAARIIDAAIRKRRRELGQ